MCKCTMSMKQYCFWFVLFAILFVYVGAKRKALGKVTYEFNYAGVLKACEEDDEKFADVGDLKFIKDSSTTTVLGGSFSISEPVNYGTAVFYNTYKLTEAGREPSWSFEIPDVCEHVAQRGMPWSGVIDEMNLNPRSCPIPEGKYVINNLKMDMSSFNTALSKDNVGEYEMIAKIYKYEGVPPQKKLLSCIRSGYRIDEVRETLVSI